MKRIQKYISVICLFAVTLLILVSCNDDFLDQKPESEIIPENYLNEESQLAAYAITLYDFNTPDFQKKTIAEIDADTDNQAHTYYDHKKYAPGQWKVDQTGGEWNFEDIRKCNYFLSVVLPRWKESSITGSSENIDHYLGEIYFLRAWAYFKRLQTLGDFPIVRTVLPDQKEELTAASERDPRNEVARFILADLDSAMMLMKNVSPDGNKNRLSKACAQLFSSRVALFEATWLKYFKGTAFVPNGPGWPGADKSYNASYSFPSGSIDGEIDFFLTKAMENSKKVADAFALVSSTGSLQQDVSEPVNPYYEMFAQTNMAGFSEVLLWRDYDMGLGEFNSSNQLLQAGSICATKGMVDGFLMKNGLPIYDPASGYAGDDSVHLVRVDRDERLQLFLKEPGQKNVLYFSNQTTWTVPIEPYPPIVTLPGTIKASATGYNLRKGLNFDASTAVGDRNTVGVLVFRATEAYLNYIEACYEKNGNLDGTAQSYWQQVRERAGVDSDYNKTIEATIMANEGQNDWGAYSAGQLIDKTLYNIRRERRCELMAEGLRYMDLVRWRAMDQMIATPFHIEGIKLWGGYMDKWYPASTLVYGQGDASSVSDPALSPYLRPYEINPNSLVYNGYKWNMAHYLYPIAIQHFLITADGGGAGSSPIYQNPGWPLTAGEGPSM